MKRLLLVSLKLITLVVGKSGFTKSAKNLAASTNVILISDIELENLENLVL